MLSVLLNSKNLTLYKLEKASNLSHATLSDLFHEKTDAQRCSCALIHAIASALGISMDELYAILSYEDLSPVCFNESFDLFKSNVCHELKALGFKDFLRKHIRDNSVLTYFHEGKKLESLYLLCMIDYLCTEHGLPVIEEYDAVRQYKLDKLYVPKSVYLLLQTKSAKISSLYKQSIPSFLAHNILEADVYAVE